MAIKTAEAALIVEATVRAITGFVNWAWGELDPNTGTIKPLSDGHWSQLSGSSWSSFRSFNINPRPIIWTSPVVDNQLVRYFTINIAAEYQGTISYLIHVSETGVFNGEETEYLIEEGNLNIPVFYGRYFHVTARVTGSELARMSIESSSKTYTIQINDVDSSTLDGTNTNRIIPLARPVSAIGDIKIAVKAAPSYPVNLYVSDTATSEVLIPVIKSKSNTTPSFALYGIDNDPRDGIVDITITAYPRQVIADGNIFAVE